VSATAIRLMWDLTETPGDDLESFELYYNDSNFKQNVHITISPPKNVYLMEDLSPNTVYNIKVAARSSRGEGAYSTTISISTIEAGTGRRDLTKNCLLIAFLFLILSVIYSRNSRVYYLTKNYQPYCVTFFMLSVIYSRNSRVYFLTKNYQPYYVTFFMLCVIYSRIQERICSDYACECAQCMCTCSVHTRSQVSPLSVFFVLNSLRTG